MRWQRTQPKRNDAWEVDSILHAETGVVIHTNTHGEREREKTLRSEGYSAQK